MSDQQKLASMLSAAPGLSAGVGSSISSVEDIISDLTEQSSAIQGSITDVAETQARDIIDNTILIDKGGDYITYGGTFGTIDYTTGNITDWQVIKLVPPVFPDLVPTPTTIYTYTPGDYPDLDELVSDYAFGNNYLTRPLTSGATYGILPNIFSLGTAKSILEENKSILDQSVTIFAKYV
jgi:hypothetical protein